MTDLEMTRLCAQAMGYDVLAENDASGLWCRGRWNFYFRPLSDDEVGNAQAMALVKRFELQLTWMGAQYNQWCVIRYSVPFVGEDAMNANLNRAIVESVALMQTAIQGACNSALSASI